MTDEFAGHFEQQKGNSKKGQTTYCLQRIVGSLDHLAQYRNTPLIYLSHSTSWNGEFKRNLCR